MIDKIIYLKYNYKYINMENLKKDIEIQIKRAYFDLIEEHVNSNPPDFDWIIKLYSEIVGRMTVFLKRDSTLRQKIISDMDIELFSQIVKNDAFNSKDMKGLVEYTFSTMVMLGSPARDKETNDMKNQVLELANNSKTTFGEIVSLYLKNTHICLDNYHIDFENAIKNDIKLEYLKNL